MEMTVMESFMFIIGALVGIWLVLWGTWRSGYSHGWNACTKEHTIKLKSSVLGYKPESLRR